MMQNQCQAYDNDDDGDPTMAVDQQQHNRSQQQHNADHHHDQDDDDDDQPGGQHPGDGSESFYPMNGHYYANYGQPDPNDPNGQHHQQQQQVVAQQRHWSEAVYSMSGVPMADWSIAGGSDYGQLPYFIDSGDIILEIDGHRVAGLTRQDVIDVVASRPVHDLKAVTGSLAVGLPVELREYLSRRFIRGSIDHDLQATIRDNVYLRTIPCTTRQPKPGEIDGVDYKFVTQEQFSEMDRAGVLLESGNYSGHFYGTPLPLSSIATINQMQVMVNGTGNGHSDNNERLNSVGSPPSEQPYDPNTGQGSIGSSMAMKRRRNRSNIAAIDAASLPHGWERISDAHYGVYYIDHINKRTQYERPYETELVKSASGFGFTLIEVHKGLVVVKSIIAGGPAQASGVIQPGDVLVSVSGVSVAGLQHSDIARLFSTFSVGDRIKLTFARGYQLPADLADEEVDFLTVQLSKGPQGFGFTISDGHAGQKVKKILDVDRCGQLKQGDVLMSLNGQDLSSLSHLEVVEALKQCPMDESAVLMVKRKKRFRSKTPMTLESQSWEKESTPQRNCKTPNAEMLARRGMEVDWGGGGHQQELGQHQQMVDQMNDQVYHLKSQSAPLLPANPINLDDHQFVHYRQHPQQQSHQPQPPSHQLPQPPAISPPGEDDFEYYRAQLARSESGFGFRIVGGAEEGRNVAIGSIVIGGVAHRDGVLKAGDEIVSINDRNVMGASHNEVVMLMSQTGASVSILVRRKRDSDAYDVQLNRDPGEGFGFVIISCGACALIGRIIDGSPAQRCQRLHIRDRIVAVNGQDITGMQHPDIVSMIKESGSALLLRIIPADCYTVELIRGQKGFGFSIRGGAEFNGMPLFILRIAPDGPAWSLLSVGDEIIEINGYSTVGLTHADAVAIISQSGPAVKLKLRRNYQPVGGFPPPPPVVRSGHDQVRMQSMPFSYGVDFIPNQFDPNPGFGPGPGYGHRQYVNQSSVAQ